MYIFTYVISLNFLCQVYKFNSFCWLLRVKRFFFFLRLYQEKRKYQFTYLLISKKNKSFGFKKGDSFNPNMFGNRLLLHVT